MMGELLGRFHPLIVHLPIGILFVTFLMELSIRYLGKDQLKKSISFLLFMTVVFSAFAWITGWIMPKGGEFDAELVRLHFWSAVGMTITTLLSYIFYTSKPKKVRRFYFPTLCISILLLTITGHYGGSLTHGETHLTKSLHKEEKPLVQDANMLKVYADIIQPILKKHCYSCHNDGKKKGGLNMSTIEGLAAGGDNGVIIKSGFALNSPILKRILLPKEDEEHMPPSGKKQLSAHDIKLIDWWIAGGATFHKKVEEYTQDEDVKKILKSYEQDAIQINTDGMKMIDQNHVNSLAADGFKVYPLNENNPLVFVITSANDPLETRSLKKLKKIKDQVIELDLSGSNLNDEMISQLASFKNLQKLKIPNTEISSKAINQIIKLDHLAFLNLYGTKVDDEVFKYLGKMKGLKSVYLWQTDVTDAGVKEFKEAYPAVQLNYKIPDGIFNEIQLMPPLINGETEIFNDSLEVSLDINLQGVDIFYTLDGSIPDSNALKYTAPITIKNTCKLKAICTKDDWITSEPSESVFIKAGYKIEAAHLKNEPNKKYKAEGASSLIDLQKGTTRFSEGHWLGFESQDVEISLDLGTPQLIENIAVSSLEDIGSYIFFPKGMIISSSLDGMKFSDKAKLDIPTSKESHPTELKTFLTEFDAHQAQFVKIKIQATLYNPDWHSAPGAKNWVFVDEVFVN